MTFKCCVAWWSWDYQDHHADWKVSAQRVDAQRHLAVLRPAARVVVHERELAALRLEDQLLQRLVGAARCRHRAVSHDLVHDPVADRVDLGARQMVGAGTVDAVPRGRARLLGHLGDELDGAPGGGVAAVRLRHDPLLRLREAVDRPGEGRVDRGVNPGLGCCGHDHTFHSFDHRDGGQVLLLYIIFSYFAIVRRLMN